MSIELSKKDNANAANANADSSKDDFAELRDREFVSQINQMRKLDNWTNWRYLSVEYSYLAVVMGLGFLLSVLWVQAIISTWVYVPILVAVSVLIGIGQHRLVMLGHEASHFALFRNKALNELVSDWFCFYPIWVTTYNYRIQHMAHHQHTNDPEKDPDFAYMSVCGHHYTPPMERNDFLWRCILGPAMAIPNQLRFLYIRLKLALLTGVLRKFRRRGSWASRLILVSFLVTYLSGLGYVYFGGHLTMLWPMTAFVLIVASGFVCIARTNSLIEGTFKPYVNPKFALIGRMTYIALLFSTLVHLRLATGLPFVMAYYALWVLPLATTFSFLMILREDIQHSHTEEGRFRNTRDAEVPWLMKWAVFPYGMDLHLAHHLFSMVPHYRLPELDELLQSKTPYQEQREIFGEELFHTGHSHTA